MKKLILLLLFILLVSFGQSVIYDGIKLNGFDDMVKMENELMWYNQDSSIQVVPLGALNYLDAEIIEIAKTGNEMVELLDYTEISDIQNNLIPYAVFKLTDSYSNQRGAIGFQIQTVVQKQNNYYKLITLIFSKEKEEKDKERIIVRVIGYMDKLIKQVLIE